MVGFNRARGRAGRGPLVSALCLSTLAAVPVAAQPAGPESGTLVVANKGANTVRLIDVASGATLATLPTGEQPHEAVVTADGAHAVITDYGGRTLTVLDVPGRSVVRTIDLGRHTRPHGIAVMPDDEHVAVTSEASGHVVVVRIEDGEIVQEIETGHPGSHMLAVPGDGRHIYTGNMGDDTASRLDVTGSRAVRTFEVPETPEAIGVSRDGEDVWVGSNAEGTVSAIDTESGAVETVLEGFGWPYRIVFSPDGSTVVLPDLRGHELRIVDRESRTERARLSLPDMGPQGVVITPDSRWAFLSLSAAGRVAVIDLADGVVVREIEAGPRPDGIGYTVRTINSAR